MEEKKKIQLTQKKRAKCAHPFPHSIAPYSFPNRDTMEPLSSKLPNLVVLIP